MNVERRTAIIDKRADAVLFRLSAFVMMVVMIADIISFFLSFIDWVVLQHRLLRLQVALRLVQGLRWHWKKKVWWQAPLSVRP